MSQYKNIVTAAERLARKCKNWADLSNALFDPFSGLVAKSFPDAAERKAFRKSETYDALHALVSRKTRETGVIEGSVPTKSGRFVVRLPRSMHAALEREAASEGTSLNQLVLAKLAVQLSDATASHKGTQRKRTRQRKAKFLGPRTRPSRAPVHG